MNLPLDPEFSSGFFDEIKTALPLIRGYVEKYQAFSLDSESMFEAYRLTHSMRNSGSMLELHRVRNLATELEGVFETLGELMTPLDENATKLIFETLDEIEKSLTSDVAALPESELIDPLRAFRSQLSQSPGSGSKIDPGDAPLYMPSLEWDHLPSLEDHAAAPPIELTNSSLDLPAPEPIDPDLPKVEEVVAPELIEPNLALPEEVPAPESVEPNLTLSEVPSPESVEPNLPKLEEVPAPELAAPSFPSLPRLEIPVPEAKETILHQLEVPSPEPMDSFLSGLDLPAPESTEPSPEMDAVPAPQLSEENLSNLDEPEIPAPHLSLPSLSNLEAPAPAPSFSNLDVPPPEPVPMSISRLELPTPSPGAEVDIPLPLPSFSGIDTTAGPTLMSLELTTDPELDAKIPVLDLPIPMPSLVSVPSPAPTPTAAAPPAAKQPPPELLEIFLHEAQDHLTIITEVLPALRANPANREYVQKIRRSVHTLKGTAAMVGFHGLTHFAHRMEDFLDLLYEGEREVTPEIVQLLFTSADTLEDFTKGIPDQEKLKGLYEQYSVLLADTEQAGTEAPEVVADEPEQVDLPQNIPEMQPGQYLRVPIARIDELVKLVSELVINRSEFEQKLTSLTRHLDELKLSTNRLRKASTKLETEYEVRTLGGRLFNAAGSGSGSGSQHPDQTLAAFQPHGFDDLEFDRYTDFHLITRDLSETTTDLQTVGTELSAVYGDFDGYLNRQTQLTSELQDKLMRVRMLPLASLTPRLSRTVRNVADEQGKQVELLLEGQNTELDKTVLEEMTEPFLHLLRNAVDHGIESPAERTRAGKTSQGTIRIKAYPQGTQVVIQIIDDGRGIDPQAVRESAITKGLLSREQADATSDADAIQMVLRPGFSLAKEITQISGRGVGLDIVAAQVHRLKGTLGIETHLGIGTTFTIRLPLTLAVLRALMVKVHGQTFAIPLGSVRFLQRLDPKDMGMIGQEEIIRIGEKIYPKIHLGKALKLKPVFGEEKTNPPLIVLDVGDRSIALLVDELLGGREIVVKNLGTHLRRVPGIAGATLLGDGTVALIVNPPDLLGYREVKSRGLTPTRSLAPARPKPTQTEGLRILVVDDSPSVRRIVSTTFKNIGWTTIPAKDGLDALEVLHHAEEFPDAVMLDVEMPRMDGYELLSTLRSHSNYKDLPVVMVTSRAHEKHRRKAMDLGASAYLVKPYQEENLIRILRDLVQSAAKPVRN